jgi:hypothetical protein
MPASKVDPKVVALDALLGGRIFATAISSSSNDSLALLTSTGAVYFLRVSPNGTTKTFSIRQRMIWYTWNPSKQLAPKKFLGESVDPKLFALIDRTTAVMCDAKICRY